MLAFFKKYYMLLIIAVFIIIAVMVADNASKVGLAQMPNPITEVDTIEQAQQFLNFNVSQPSISAYKDMKKQLLVINKKIISVVYTDKEQNKIIYRTGKKQPDISGDYNEYTVTKTEAIEKINVTLKGKAENEYNLAIWDNKNYSYSYYSDKPFTLVDFTATLISIK